MSDLVERLRKIGSGDPWGYNIMTVAADRIEALEAEIERLRSIIDKHSLRVPKQKAVVAAAKDWFLDDSEYDDTEAALIMAVGNYLAALEVDDG